MAANAVVLVIGGYFNNIVTHGGIYPDIQFERNRLNIFRVGVFTSSGSTGGGDAKTIISPNTSFDDINMVLCASSRTLGAM